jgi:DNA-directed RNA polymerase specialized sigma24 family protein
MNTIGNVTHVDFIRYDHFRPTNAPRTRRCPPEATVPADALVERIVLGDGVALDELKTRYRRPLLVLAEDILDDENEAERLVDCVFEEACLGWPPERGRVRAWLLRLVRRAAYRRRRALRELDA